MTRKNKKVKHPGSISKKKLRSKMHKKERKEKRNPDNFLLQPSFDTRYNVEQSSQSSTHVVYIDGACWYNGQQNAKAGYGVYWGADHPLNVAAPLPGLAQTSSRAEFKAAICALEQAISNEYQKLTLRTDSLVVAETMTKLIPHWRETGWTNQRGEPILDIDLIQRLEELLTLGVIEVKVEHVKGHSGDHGNECADRLATQGAMM